MYICMSQYFVTSVILCVFKIHLFDLKYKINDNIYTYIYILIINVVMITILICLNVIHCLKKM